MVKSIIYTLTAIILCVATFIGVDIYLKKQFDDVYNAVDILYYKVEDGTANREDAYAVKSLWNEKKKVLHVLIPHNDISYIDYWLSETCGLIYNQNFELALGKVEVLREICKNLPDNYMLKYENVF